MTKDQRHELAAWLFKFTVGKSGPTVAPFDAYATGALCGTALQFPEMTFFEVVAKMRELTIEEEKEVHGGERDQAEGASRPGNGAAKPGPTGQAGAKTETPEEG